MRATARTTKPTCSAAWWSRASVSALPDAGPSLLLACRGALRDQLAHQSCGVLRLRAVVDHADHLGDGVELADRGHLLDDLKRRQTLRVLLVDRGATLDQRADRIETPVMGGDVQRGVALRAFDVRLC